MWVLKPPRICTVVVIESAGACLLLTPTLQILIGKTLGKYSITCVQHPTSSPQRVIHFSPASAPNIFIFVPELHDHLNVYQVKNFCRSSSDLKNNLEPNESALKLSIATTEICHNLARSSSVRSTGCGDRSTQYSSTYSGSLSNSYSLYFMSTSTQTKRHLSLWQNTIHHDYRRTQHTTGSSR